jgi:hypothetical protein
LDLNYHTNFSSSIQYAAMAASRQLKSSKPSRSFFRDAKNAAPSSRLIITSGSIIPIPFNFGGGAGRPIHPAALIDAKAQGMARANLFAFQAERG